MVPSRFQISSKAVPGLVPTQFQASSKAVLKWRLMAQSLSTDLSPSDSDGLRSKTKFAMRTIALVDHFKCSIKRGKRG